MTQLIRPSGLRSLKIVGLFLGLLLFCLIQAVPTPSGLSADAHDVAAVTVLMAVWWISECLPIGVTALVPFVAYPLLTDLSSEEVAHQYGNPTIFLMIGGFMIALAMQRWGLHRRIALLIIASTGTRPAALLGGFMIASAGLSMWVSNTATVVMLLPIAIAVVGQVGSDMRADDMKRFAEPLMLGVAYAASVGGVATLLGSPPNLILQGQARALLGEAGEIQFVQWFVFALPLSTTFLIFAWWYLARRVPSEVGGSEGDVAPRRELERLGPWSRSERMVLAVFLLTALAWIGKSDLEISSYHIPGWASVLGLPSIHDGVIAICAALVLFVIPISTKAGIFVLDWATANQLPWDIVLLMGGGFALAEGFRVTGLAEWIGLQFALFHDLPLPVLILTLCLLVTFLTEVTSNTATAVVLLPILASAATAIGIEPLLLMVPATISCSFAFMLPVATPPNAIAFGSGHISVRSMARAGWVLNIVGALLTTTAMLVWGRTVFNLQ